MKKANDFLNSLNTPENTPEPKLPASNLPTPKAPKPKLTPEEKKAAKEAKKEARKAKKAAKKAKKEAKRNPAVLYMPERMQGFKFSLPLGYLFRFFAIAFSIFGVLWLFCDAFQLTEVSPGLLLLYCFGAVTAFSLIFIGKWFILAGIGIIGAYIGLFFAFCGNPLTFFVSGIESVINRMMTRLSDAGFAAFGTVNLPDFGGLHFSGSQLESFAYGGIFAVATVLAIIFSAFSARRTRLLPMLIAGGGLCAICFTYNLCETNWGIACVLAGLCSAAVLSAYDKTYKAHKRSKKSRAYSGYSAALAGLLALVILVIPAANMTEPWGEISFIAEPMKDARMILTTFLTGGNPEYNKMNTLMEQRSNDLEQLEFKGVDLFQVKSYYNRAVYLRSWIGNDFSYSDNAWNQLDSIDYDEMVRELKNERNGFTGDQITYDRYFLLDDELTEEALQESHSLNGTDLGFLATYIDIDFINNTGLLYLLPSSYIAPMGLFEFESRTESYHERYDLHADGMYTSGWFNLFKEYSAAAVLPNYMVEDYGKVAENTVKYYEMLFDYTSSAYDSSLSNEELVANFRSALDQAGLTRFPTDALANYLALDDSSRLRWYNQYVRLFDEYSAYVHETYLDVPSASHGINQIYDKLEEKINAAETDHDKIMTVINYLSDHYKYTTTPTVSEERTYTNDLDYFLLEGKEGYCVQFATSAALLLRKAGFPTRYVQGYIADDFNPTEDANGNHCYTSVIEDSNAHAWVEVYIDGLGWRIYETTPAFYESLYYIEPEPIDPDNPETTTPSITTDMLPITTVPVTTLEPEPDETPAETTGSPKEEPSDFTIDLAQLIKMLVALVILAIAATLIIWQIRRAKKISDGRTYYIDRAEYGSFDEKSDFDNVAGVLCDSIYEVHYIIGNRPKQGEQPVEFAKRIDSAPIDGTKRALKTYNRLMMLPSTLSEVTRLIEKQEFGKVMNRTELAILGGYLRALIASEYRNLPIWKKIWYRYIRFMI